jgi:hypothetical protein
MAEAFIPKVGSAGKPLITRVTPARYPNILLFYKKEGSEHLELIILITKPSAANSKLKQHESNCIKHRFQALLSTAELCSALLSWLQCGLP